MDRFLEFDAHLMNDVKPSNYFNGLVKTGIYEEEYPYTLLGDLMKVPQSPKHHPEGSVWNHTMLVLDNAGERKHLSQNPKVLMWSALLHDLGKASATKITKGRITSYDHDKLGERLAVKFLKDFTADDEFITQVSKLVRWHMQILFVTMGLPFADVGRMVSEVPIEEVALLGLCDRLGRGNMTLDKKLEEEKSILTFLEKCNKYVKNKNSLHH
ncbi:HDIG domain-containing metalloprotein [Desulfosporosinus sp. BICA1-9]|uniref:HDIG domain-containing metalloprotein n=1 Tax=Desulfosporosinus sp. BICA1-9 TaxID=1531958 RepID=UPI00054C69EF|nr:HDIG domain-containing metalloprotein [Desulfosporosinus sp. BICA1-9]KJS79725.1 MAG: phosphohydrolase [Desulfosporosinus sp. BICA1-9]HBW34228.1 HDIG domain-containing protein [Desulfosporosinus sp.]